MSALTASAEAPVSTWSPSPLFGSPPAVAAAASPAAAASCSVSTTGAGGGDFTAVAFEALRDRRDFDLDLYQTKYNISAIRRIVGFVIGPVSFKKFCNCLEN